MAPRQDRRPADSGLRAGRAPGARPLAGHLAAFYRTPLSFLDGLPRHGDLVEVRLGRRPVFVLCHPALVRRVLTDDRTYDRDGAHYERSRRAMGNSLATCPYADHRAQRRLMQPAFRPDHLDRYAAVMRQTIGETMDGWRHGQETDLVRELFGLATKTALRALFGADLPPAEARELHDALDTFLKGIYRQSLVPWAARLPIPANRRYARALACWRAHTTRLIDTHRAQTDDGQAADRAADRKDVLSHLLSVRMPDGTPVADDAVHDQSTALVLAGIETTAAALAWACHLLSHHPDVEEELSAEARGVLGERAATQDDLPRLPLTGRVVTETLRLYPPAWIIPRITTVETELAGLCLPAGSTVVFSPYVVHRRGDLYPEPHRFLPGRWAADEGPGGGGPGGARSGGERSGGARSGDPDRSARLRAYAPFGFGAHRCIGEEFALTEATMALATLAARWRLRAVPGVTIRPAARAVLAPERLPMYLYAR
ncbi:cytochrome P450 [Streptomyces sp. URMC 127]|uniref:cytochrome P450 n=1 Tax=Streptomyces sp. URMC 127 TaxID=3423402 RepID=UPI003F1B513A